MLRHCLRLLAIPLLLSLFSPAARSAPVEPKRRNPEVLAPVEFQADVARVCPHIYMIVMERDRKMFGLLSKPKRGTVNEILFVEENELKLVPRPEFARDIYPLRVAVVGASFPFRKQVEAFQEALRLRSMDELRDEPGAFPRFAGVSVERREMSPKKTDWAPLDLSSRDSPYLALVNLTQKEFQLEPAGWKPAQVSGLTMPLPVLARGRYPECTLPLLTKTLADPKARALPDYGLLRFLDVTVAAGHAYEYRVQVRLVNPNFGKKARVEQESLAEPKELLGAWTRVPGTVALGPDLLYYAVDAKRFDLRFPGPAADREEVAFQVHGWMAHYELTRGTKTDFYPVGAWVVAERMLVRRGEHVGGKQKIKLPFWAPEQSRYIVAGMPRAGGVDVDFSPGGKVEKAPLLIDFEGGKEADNGVEAEAPVEVLMLSADGRLFARNSQADVADPVREQRLADWKKWLRDGTLP